MTGYRVPTRDIWFVLEDLVDWRQVAALPGFEEATPELVRAALAEAASLAEEVIAPTNVVGDQAGVCLEDGEVRVAAPLKDAFERFRDGGWTSLPGNPEYGGQGLPALLAIALSELWSAANLAWSNCALLAEGAIHAIESHANAALKARYLPKLIAGEWTGTMNLTEPQAGSDLGLIRSTATPDGERYRIKGQKIFITYGDHDMAENIVHLVLARLPDAPPGVRGISLFLVPKRLPLADGGLGERNAVRVVSLERKLGIHGSPTCVMDFDGAEGHLVGEPHQGLAAMFTMMNHARIRVGVQGLAIAERAYQHALGYARERVQGNLPGNRAPVTIIQHPDVRRMLMEIKAQIEAMRAVAYVGASHLDRAARSEGAARAAHQARVDLMTPVIKAWLTETGQQLASLAVQVFGGMGFVEETGAAQHYRDARITTIYEGTTGIQAADLMGRKVLRDQGAALRAFIGEMRDVEATLATAMPDLLPAFRIGVDQLTAGLDWVLAHAGNDFAIAGAVAFDFLMLVGDVAGAHEMARGALAARRRMAEGDDERGFLTAKEVTARFYLEHILPRAASRLAAVQAGAETVMALTEEQFEPAPLV